MIVETLVCNWLHVGAITVWPFIFIKVGLPPWRLALLIVHEKKHYDQQWRWIKWGLIIGQPIAIVLWYYFYLFALPVWWNPWRRRWETEAFAAEGWSPEEIAARLHRWPYMLR